MELVSAQSSQLYPLSTLRSSANSNKLSAQTRDRLIDHISGIEVDVSDLIDTVSQLTIDIIGVDEEYVEQRIIELSGSLTNWANNTFLTGMTPPQITYYRGVYDNTTSLGNTFARTCSDP